MNKNILLLLLIIFSVNAKIKMEIPESVEKYLENYLFEMVAKGEILTFDNNEINLNEIIVGFPVKKYRINYCILDTCSPDIFIDELIIPCGEWIVPIYWGKKVIYYITLKVGYDGCREAGKEICNSKSFSIFDHLNKINLFKKEEFPVLIISGNQIFVHFPKLSKKNMKLIDFGRVENEEEINGINKIQEDNSSEVIHKLQINYKAGKPYRDSMIKVRPELQYFFYNTEPGYE